MSINFCVVVPKKLYNISFFYVFCIPNLPCNQLYCHCKCTTVGFIVLFVCVCLIIPQFTCLAGIKDSAAHPKPSITLFWVGLRYRILMDGLMQSIACYSIACYSLRVGSDLIRELFFFKEVDSAAVICYKDT